MGSFYIGVDVGGTHVRIVSCDETLGNISSVDKSMFVKSGKPEPEIKDNICSLIEAVIKKKEMENKKLKGIGLSLAALFNRKTGDIAIWPNNKVWNGFPIRKYLEERFKVPVVLEDDANSAALGEHSFGAGKGYRNLAYITISTGIGCGLILDNSLYTGANGWAGEIGHIKVIDGGPECSCGMKGCLQSVASGPAILRRYIGKKAFEGDAEHDLRTVVELARQGDQDARDCFSAAGEYVGKMIAGLVMLLDLPVIVLGGGVTEAGDILFEPLNNTLKAQLRMFKRVVDVKPSGLKDDNAVIGALSLIYRHVSERGAVE